MKTPLKIFFMEDDNQLAELLDIRLKNLGFSVCGRADNASAAVDCIRETSPDIALLDIDIQGRNEGIAVGDYLLHCTDIPFIYMTGHDETSVLEQARRTVPDGFLLKPFDDRQLRVVVEMAMRKD